MTPPLPATYVNVRINERRTQGWEIPLRNAGRKIDWTLAADLKEEGVDTVRMARLFDVHEGTIEYGRINEKKPRRSAIPRSQLRCRR